VLLGVPLGVHLVTSLVGFAVIGPPTVAAGELVSEESSFEVEVSSSSTGITLRVILSYK
jgi:hypothetical protein